MRLTSLGGRGQCTRLVSHQSRVVQVEKREKCQLIEVMSLIYISNSIEKPSILAGGKISDGLFS